LRYIGRKANGVPVLILDSSDEPNHFRNSRAISEASLWVRHIRSSSQTAILQKWANGVALVTTPYCSICADDDVVFFEAIKECISILESEDDAIGAHGRYVNFRSNDSQIDVSNIVYSVNGSGKSAIDRLCVYFRNYESPMYGVYRKDVLLATLEYARKAPPVLFQELLQAAGAFVRGQVRRADALYYARSTDRSLPYTNWHPQEILANNPETLLDLYSTYRTLLVDLCLTDEDVRRSYSVDTVRRIVDLVHLRYLTPLLDSSILDFMITEQMKGKGGRGIADLIWDRWVYSGQIPNARRRTNWLLASESIITVHNKAVQNLPPLLVKLFMRLRRSLGEANYSIESELSDGAVRRYVFHSELLTPQSATSPYLTKHDVHSLMENLNAYY
jgi:glycosyltransferase domain-containing protein